MLWQPMQILYKLNFGNTIIPVCILAVVPWSEVVTYGKQDLVQFSICGGICVS